MELIRLVGQMIIMGNVPFLSLYKECHHLRISGEVVNTYLLLVDNQRMCKIILMCEISL